MTNKIKAGHARVTMTEPNHSSLEYKSSGKNCSNRIVRFISPVPSEECVVQVQNNYFAEYPRGRSGNRAVKMKVLMRADTHKHINVIKEEDEDPKKYKCNASQVCGTFFSVKIRAPFVGRPQPIPPVGVRIEMFGKPPGELFPAALFSLFSLCYLF